MPFKPAFIENFYQIFKLYPRGSDLTLQIKRLDGNFNVYSPFQWVSLMEPAEFPFLCLQINMYFNV